ncbi:MAG: heavy-metal-associated domain-containing protein [Deltaproteobacteria bacterium]|nr:heavy-metal-associated domain-containing protein [Deltaproteobacteria bacterium]
MKFYVALFCLFMFATPTFVHAEEITVTVKGMVCSFCAQGIKKTFGKNADVADVEVDLEHKRVSLKVRQGATLSDESITTTINDAGYDVLKIERGPHA